MNIEQAIDILKNKEADYFMISNLTGKTLVNLIEKQQKEIEELKKYEEGYKLLSYSLNNYISKDKIKAMLENEIINISGFECVAKEDVQSLLEKE